MAYWERSYQVGAILGSAGEPGPLWTGEAWRAATPILTPLIDLARDEAAVRSTQFAEDNETPVRFGRIGWNDAGHQKWIHGSPTNAATSASWQFLASELWAPSWTKCAQQPPDVFFGLRNMGHRQPLPPKFSHLVVLAVANDLAVDTEQLVVRSTTRLR